MSTLTVQQQQQKPVIKSPIAEKIVQNHIPLVHVLTSRINNDNEKVKDEPFQFEKIIKLLLDSHSVKYIYLSNTYQISFLIQEHLVDRRIRLCHKLYRHHRNGYVRNLDLKKYEYSF